MAAIVPGRTLWRRWDTLRPVPALAIALALLVSTALHRVAVRVADRRRTICGVAVLGIAALLLYFAFSIPAAQLTYHEAISRRLPGNQRVAIIESSRLARKGPMSKRHGASCRGR